jgi:hypothetical protein
MLWVRSLLMRMTVATGAIGLAWCGIQAAQQDRMVGSANAIDLAGYARFKVLRIWLPRSLDEIARGPTSYALTHTHSEFQRFLAARNQKDLWYALTARAYQRNGEYSDCTYVRYPYKESLYFLELLEVLAVAAGNSSPSGMAEFQESSVTVMPDEMLECDSRQVMCAFVRDLSAPTDRTTAR